MPAQEKTAKSLNHFSYSKINRYYQCPLSFKLTYIDKIETVKGEPLIVGKGFHRVAGAHLQHLVKNKLSTDVTALREIGKAAISGPTKMDGPIPAQYQGAVLDLSEGWARTYVLDYEKVVDIENLEKIWIISDQDKNMFWFVLDLLQIDGKKAIITDWKSGFQMPADKEIAKDLQLRIYAYCIKQIYPQIEEFEVHIYYSRWNVDKVATLDLEDVAKAKEEIVAGITQIKADTEFKATPGAGCGWCDVGHACPAYAKAVNMEGTPPSSISDTEHAIRTAEQIVLLEKAVKGYKAALNTYTAKAGLVQIGGLEFGHFPRVSKKYDPDDIADLVKRNPDLIPFLKIDGRKKIYGELAEELAAIASETTTTTFTHKKVAK